MNQPFTTRRSGSARLEWLGTLLLCMLWLSALVGCAQENDRKVSLRGYWRFSLGDNKKYAAPDYNDTEWEKIYVPSPWQQEGFRNYRGYAWYRKKFIVAFTKDESLVLQLGRIDDADEVYVNGHLVGAMGGFPPDYFTASTVNRSYMVPAAFLNAGKENVVAVRVYDEGGVGGIIGKDVGIYSYGAATSKNIFLLHGNWKFRLFDDVKWAEEQTDDKEWENVVVPASWETQGFRDYDGFAWYRKRFVLPAGFKTNDMVLLVGKIDDLDEVYINGKRVGFTGNIDTRDVNKECEQSRTYFIADEVLRPGKENVIAVRVFDTVGRGGIYEGPVVILPRNQYKEFWKRYRAEGSDWGDRWDFFSWFD
jgi:hypothetical protein